MPGLPKIRYGLPREAFFVKRKIALIYSVYADITVCNSHRLKKDAAVF